MQRALGPLFLALLLVPGVVASDSAEAWIWSPGDNLAGGLLLLEQSGLPLRLYEQLDLAAFIATPATAQAFVTLAGGKLYANEQYSLHLDRSVPYIEADRVQAALGLQRNGPTVLVIDTGVDSAHPDFQDGNLAANIQPVRQGGLVVGNLDQAPVVDAVGHGTHVASIVAGSGAGLGTTDPDNGRFRGVFANGRVASYQASTAVEGQEPTVDTLAALDSFDWAIQNQAQFNIRAVSNSWGNPGELDPDHPVNEATLRLYLAGMNVVFSAGNSGEEASLNKHCIMPWVLCVAAGDLDQRRAGFSSYGSLNDPAAYDHPDITAPGLFIRAATPVASVEPSGLVGLLGGASPSASLYADRSGTSMAAPHVAATAGLVAATNPSLSPDQVMDILIKTADPMADPTVKVGAGYLNAREAYNLALSTVGNRAAFLAGQQVKYAGPASGDAEYEADPVTRGYDSVVTASELRLPEREDLWIATPFAIALLIVAATMVVTGIRWRNLTKKSEA